MPSIVTDRSNKEAHARPNIYIYIDAWKMVDVVGFVALGNHGYVNVQTSCTTWDV